MYNNIVPAETLTLQPIYVSFYVPPITFKGDPIGHIGVNDVFMLILKGSMILFIDDNFYIAREGQLVFFPKGKMRRYTGLTKELTLYTMSFSAEADGVNLMDALKLSDRNHVVTPDNTDEVKILFENSGCVERKKDLIYNVSWAGNLLRIINIFEYFSKKYSYISDKRFDCVTEYMRSHINEGVALKELSDMVYMQPTYFCRRFKEIYGVSPISYFTTLRVYKAMELLINSDLNNEEISELLGINDVSYFSRWFKKSCGLSPGEYRIQFKKQNTERDE